MLKRSNYIKANKQDLKSVLPNYCLFFLLSLFLTWGQFSSFAGTPREIVIHEDFTSLLSKHLYTHSHHSIHLSLELPSITNGRDTSDENKPSAPENNPETSDENEEIDNIDDGCNQLILKNSSASIFNISSLVKIHFSQIIQSVERRVTLPLFILYHSWKSFLI